MVCRDSKTVANTAGIASTCVFFAGYDLQHLFHDSQCDHPEEVILKLRAWLSSGLSRRHF